MFYNNQSIFLLLWAESQAQDLLSLVKLVSLIALASSINDQTPSFVGNEDGDTKCVTMLGIFLFSTFLFTSVSFTTSQRFASSAKGSLLNGGVPQSFVGY